MDISKVLLFMQKYIILPTIYINGKVLLLEPCSNCIICSYHYISLLGTVVENVWAKPANDHDSRASGSEVKKMMKAKKSRSHLIDTCKHAL